ncbi:MAG: ribonuclease III [Oscillospiraceae bacterium]|nr:ribonuclease III [Oscillospiraceae bacterium]
MNKIEKIIGYEFKNKTLLDQAFTHSSYAHENNTESYERLEFLGDSVLGFVTAGFLFDARPVLSEGTMSRTRSELVCEQALYQVAHRLGFGELLLLSRGEELSGGRTRVSILADSVEALIAAIYLDGGIKNAKAFIFRFVLPETVDLHEGRPYDYKSALQELVQKNAESRIEYRLVKETGPDHDKRFIFSVLVNGTLYGEGEGRTKKEAEQNAAAAALKSIKE